MSSIRRKHFQIFPNIYTAKKNREVIIASLRFRLSDQNGKCGSGGVAILVLRFRKQKIFAFFTREKFITCHRDFFPLNPAAQKRSLLRQTQAEASLHNYSAPVLKTDPRKESTFPSVPRFADTPQEEEKIHTAINRTDNSPTIRFCISFPPWLERMLIILYFFPFVHIEF